MANYAHIIGYPMTCRNQSHRLRACLRVFGWFVLFGHRFECGKQCSCLVVFPMPSEAIPKIVE